MRTRKHFDTAHRSASVCRPRLEFLEDRITPAVQVFVRAGILFIQGDQDANVVGLIREGSEVRVSTGMNQTQVFENVAKVLANLGGGNDSFTATIHPTLVNPNTPTPPPFDLTVDLGAGNDLFTAAVNPPDPSAPAAVNGLDIGIAVLGQSGNDSLTFQADIPVARGELTVQLDGGDGTDTLSSNGIIHPGYLVGFNPQPEPPIVDIIFLLDGGAGNDSVSAEGTASPEMLVKLDPQPTIPIVNFSFTTNGGIGTDQITARMGIGPTPFLPPVVRADLIAGGGDGNDNIAIQIGDPNAATQSELAELSVALGGGSGGDEVGIIIINNRIERLSQKVNLGDGNDSLKGVYRNLVAIGDSAEQLRTASIDLRTGNGNDRLTLELEQMQLFGGGFHADSGLGNDHVVATLSEVEQNDNALPLSFFSGDGHDDITLLMQKVKITAGGLLVETAAGNDALFVNLSEVEFGDEAGLPTIRSGIGDDTIDLSTHQFHLGKQGFVHDAGAGNDRVIMNVSDTTAAAGAFQVLTGEGNDLVAGTIDQFAETALGINVNLGNGNDDFFAEFIMRLPPVAEVGQQFVAVMNITVLGGTGDDRISVRTLIVAPFIFPFFYSPRFVPGARFDLNLLVDGGSGQDVLKVQGAYRYPLSAPPPANTPFYVGDVQVDVLGGTNTDYVNVYWQQPGLLATIQLDALADGGAGVDAGDTSSNVAQINFEF